MEDSNKGLIKANTLDVLSNLDVVNNRDAAMILFKDLLASGKVNASTKEEVLVKFLKAKELGLPFITASDHMNVVNGKAGVDIHILRAQVLKAGFIYWESEVDYKPLYEYKDNKGTVVDTCYNDSQLPEIYEVPKGNTDEALKLDYQRITSINKIPVFKSISYVPITNDYRIVNRGTIIRFERQITMPDGTTKLLIERGKWTTRDGVNAGLHLKRTGEINSASPHLIYEQVMQEHRAWTYGARKIASDILFGLYETKELYDMNHVEYRVTEDGQAEVIQDAS